MSTFRRDSFKKAVISDAIIFQRSIMKIRMFALASLISFNCLAAVEIPEHSEIMLDEEVLEMPSVKIKDVMELLKQESWVNFKETGQRIHSIVINDGPFGPTLYFRGGPP
jgi:hypothetical protein